jgi:hypothetical protein
MDFTFHVELVSFYGNLLTLLAFQLDDQSHLGEVGLDFTDCLFNKVNVVVLAEFFKIVSLLKQSALHLKHIQ